MKSIKDFSFKKLINFKLSDKTVVQVKSVKVLIYFFAIMIIFTILSRFSDSLTIPRIKVTKGVEGSIDSQLTASGEISQKKEEHITVVEELMVQSVSVSQGQEVKNGDLLFTVDLTNLNEKITEVEKLVTTINKRVSRANEDYNISVSGAVDSVNNAKKAMDIASSNLDKAPEEQKEPLKMEYNAKKSEYESSLKAKEDTIRSAKRALEDAMEEGNEKEKLDLKLEKLKAISESKGEIKSSKDGTVTKISVVANSPTQVAPAVSMADESDGNQFVAKMSKDKQKKIAIGQEVTISSASGRGVIEGLKITAIKSIAEDPENVEVLVALPKGKGKVGEVANLTINGKSKKNYLCVPLEALRYDGQKPFILVVNTAETVLGKEEVARVVEVEIVEKNSTLAGIKDGGVSSWDEIILSSNKEVKNGDRVRKESN
ncbi:MAG: biotin/lipoyl-binding protein [Clostridium sp.]